jgi:hypothetical protein
MAFWQTGSIAGINEGVTANDGTGDSIRDAFIKVESNFGNISNHLSSTSIDFLGANVNVLNVTVSSNIANLQVIKTEGVGAAYSGNLVAANIKANSGLYSSNTVLSGNLNVTAQPHFYQGIVVHDNITPSANLQYDLGSPSNFFRNLYVQTQISSTQVAATSDAGLLQLHAQLLPGDNKDVGLFGKFNKNSANSFAFFGYQYSTDNFVYKITNTDATAGNSVVYDGVYGNARMGSLFLSNSTISSSPTTGALIVRGGAGVSGNVYAPTFYGNLVSNVANIVSVNVSGTVSGNLTVDGNLFSGGFQVVTTNSLGGYGPTYTGGVVTGSQVFLSAANSVSRTTGAVVVTGGVGVGGNVSAGAFYGNITGNVLTAAQPYITSLGTLTGLTVSGTTTTSALNATSIGATNITATGNVYVSTINGLQNLSVTGNVTASSGFVGTMFGPVVGQLQTNAQPNVNSLGVLSSLAVAANIATGNISANGTVSGTTAVFTNIGGTLTTNAQPNVNTLGTLTALTVTGNVSGGNFTTANTVQGLNGSFTNVAASFGRFNNLTTVSNLSATLITGTLTTSAQPNISLVNNGLTVGTSQFSTGGALTVITTATPTIIDTFDPTVFGSCKYIVQLQDSGPTPNRVQVTELLVIHDRNGSSNIPYLNAYGSVYNLGVMGTFTCSYNVAGQIQVTFTPNYVPTALTIKTDKTAITI